MPVDLHIDSALSVKRGFNASAKYIDSGQPAQSAQANLSRNILLLVSLLYIEGLYHLVTPLAVKGGPSDLGTKILQKY